MFDLLQNLRKLHILKRGIKKLKVSLQGYLGKDK